MDDHPCLLFGHGFQGRDRPLARNSFFIHGYFSWKLSETLREPSGVGRWVEGKAVTGASYPWLLLREILLHGISFTFTPGPHLPFYKLPFLFPVPTALLPPVPLRSPVSGPCHLELHFLPVPHIFPWFHSQSQQVGPTFVFLAATSMYTITDILAWGSPRFTQFHSKALFLTYWWLSRAGAAAARIPDTQGVQELAHMFRNFHGQLRNCWSFEIGGQWEVLFRCNWTTITNQSFYFLRAGSSICPCVNSPYLLEAVQMKCHQTLPKAAGQDQSWKWSGGGGASYFLYRQGLPIMFFLFVLVKFYFSFECLNLCLWPATHFLFE